MKWLPWLVFAIFGYYLVGANFSAKLGIIDDHEIAMFLGSDGKIKISEIPAVLMTTEVGQWGTYLRYRPSYYTLRVIETALWQDNATLWYVSRYGMLVLAMVLGWKIMSRYFPEVVAYIFIFYLMTIPFWTDLLTRLGPSEIYGVVALPLLIYGMQHRRLWMIVVGYIVAIGAKENFLVLFPILLLYFGYQQYNKLIGRKEVFTIIILTLYTVFIVGAIQTATSKAGADIYGTSISYSDRFARLYSYKRFIVESRHLQIALAIFFVGVAKLIGDVYKKGITVLRNNSIFNHLVVAGVVGVSIASQYIFYDSQLPSNIRYDYPVMLLFPTLQLVAVSLLIRLLPKKVWGIRVSHAIYVGLVIGMLAFIFRRGYSPIQTKSRQVVHDSQKFDQQIKNIVQVAHEDLSNTLVFVSDKYFSFEPIISVGRYLTAKEVANKMILSYAKEEGVSDPLGLELEEKFAASMEGRAGIDDPFARFSPTERLSKPCSSVTFGSALPLPDCPEIARF
jgi:hypothetical protein